MAAPGLGGARALAPGALAHWALGVCVGGGVEALSCLLVGSSVQDVLRVDTPGKVLTLRSLAAWVALPLGPQSSSLRWAHKQCPAPGRAGPQQQPESAPHAP